MQNYKNTQNLSLTKIADIGDLLKYIFAELILKKLPIIVKSVVLSIQQNWKLLFFVRKIKMALFEM